MDLGDNVPGRGQQVGGISTWRECVCPRHGEEVSVAGVDEGTGMDQEEVRQRR